MSALEGVGGMQTPIHHHPLDHSAHRSAPLVEQHLVGMTQGTFIVNDSDSRARARYQSTLLSS